MNRTTAWLLLALPLIGVLFVYYYLFIRQPQVPVIPEVVPVITPKITSIEELTEYEIDRPLPPPENRNIPVFDANEHIYGSLDAPVSILAYSNLSNPYIKVMYPEIKKIVDESSEQVNFVFRHYPTTNEPTDWVLAHGSECFYYFQGNPGFWKFIDRIITTETKTNEQIIAFATQQGIRRDDIFECTRTDDSVRTRYQKSIDTERLVADDKKAIQLSGEDVAVMPTFYVIKQGENQVRKIEGAVTDDFLKNVIADVK